MEAIDFKRLLREERKRAKLKAAAAPSDEKNENGGSIDRSSKNGKAEAQYNHWGYSDGFLGFGQLALNCISQNPRSISYSSTALERINRQPTSGSTSDQATISPEEALLNWLQNIPSGERGLGEWKVMSYGKRRVCMFGEETGGSLPPPLEEIAQELVKRGVFPASLIPNHVLLNEYQPGQGILPHTDGPRYEHRTATLSLGSDVVIKFSKRLSTSEIGSTRNNHGSENDNRNDALESGDGNQPSSLAPIQILLESGSLLVFDGDAYLNYCHGIEMDVWRDVTTDNCLNAASGKIIPRGLRYSLTFRHKKSEAKGIVTSTNLPL